MKPIIVVNFKTYDSATGEKAVKLARIHSKIARKTRTKIIVAVQPTDVYRVASNVKIDVLGQHVDYYDMGAHTGSILPESLKRNKARGSLLNHAERRIKMEAIKLGIKRLKKLGMYSVVCVPSVKDAIKVARFKPRYIAFEVPELIGTGRSISKHRPKAVSVFAKEMKKRKVIPLCGAGITTGEDVKIALKLGTKGVLLASGITKARNPGKVLMDLIKQ